MADQDQTSGSSRLPESDITAYLRDLTTDHPVDVLLRDPLREVTRMERRSLLAISVIAALVGWANLVPTELTNLGLKFTNPDRKAFLVVFMLVVAYYMVAFVVYVSSDMLVHSRLVFLTAVKLKHKLIKARGLTQTEAGAVLGIKQPHVSALMRNRSGVFSVERLMEFLTDLGQDVQITVRPTRKEHGKMSVVVAA